MIYVQEFAHTKKCEPTKGAYVLHKNKRGLTVQLVNVITQPGKLCQVNIPHYCQPFYSSLLIYFFRREQPKPSNFVPSLAPYSEQTPLVQNTVPKNIFVEILMSECTFFHNFAARNLVFCEHTALSRRNNNNCTKQQQKSSVVACLHHSWVCQRTVQQVSLVPGTESILSF